VSATDDAAAAVLAAMDPPATAHTLGLTALPSAGTAVPPPPPLDLVELHAGSRIDWADMWAGTDDADDFLIEPLIARGRGHALYAPAKAGKSLLALWLAAGAATGRTVLHHRGGEPVRTLYVDHEMTTSDVRERLADMGYGPGDDLEPLAYHCLPSLAVLDSEAGGAEVLALALAHRAELVIIDTLGRAIGGEENSADTLHNYYRWTGSPLKANGIAALRLDHAGKDAERGQRGSSAKADDVDVVWRLTARDRDHLDLVATHRRVSWVPQTVHLAQTADPLGFAIVGDSWPAGTAEVAAMLDRLDVATDAGRPTARQALNDADEKATNEVLGAAIRYRRARPSADLENLR